MRPDDRTPVPGEATAVAPGSPREGLTARLRATTWKYLGAAVLETKDGVKAVSLGRLSFVAVFTMAMVQWGGGKDPPMTMIATLGALLAYIGVGGFRAELAQVLASRKQG